MIILNCRVIRTSNFPQTVFEELEVTEKLVHYYFTILLKFLKSIFGLRQGAKEPEMPRTAAINTNPCWRKRKGQQCRQQSVFESFHEKVQQFLIGIL